MKEKRDNDYDVKEKWSIPPTYADFLKLRKIWKQKRKNGEKLPIEGVCFIDTESNI